jgi:hypothetical protein
MRSWHGQRFALVRNLLWLPSLLPALYNDLASPFFDAVILAVVPEIDDEWDWLLLERNIFE